jgi:hypothetical protein
VIPTDKQTGIGVCYGTIDPQGIRIRYLAMLGNQAGESLFHGQTSIQNQTNLSQQFDAALNAQEAAIRAFVHAAHDHGLGSVSGMTLKIVPRVNDRRKTASGPPPALTPREFVLD